jgi:DNA-binding protein YbaB
MSAEVAKITSKSTSGKGLIKVDWDGLVRSYQVEKILLEKDIAR